MLPSGNRLIFQYDGNVVIQVRGDSTLRVTGKPTIEAGTLNLKATQNLSVSAMNVEMKAQQSMSQSGTALSGQMRRVKSPVMEYWTFMVPFST